MDFTGSDWCSACKTIKKKVLTSSEFAAFARESLVLLEVDFPMQKKQSDAQKKANEALSDKFKIEGYPTLVVVNAEGKQLWREEGYAGESPKEYVAKLKKIPR
jgi:protein disulfide-isomerase